jgi:hypothetical protein
MIAGRLHLFKVCVLAAYVACPVLEHEITFAGFASDLDEFSELVVRRLTRTT